MPDSETQATATAPAPEVPRAPVVDTLANGTKVKVRLPKMRACDEKDEKGKLCAGHLKRWFFLTDEVVAKYGKDAEIYRCEHCRSLYLPNPDEKPRTRTLAF
jgi:hypothetical protein